MKVRIILTVIAICLVSIGGYAQTDVNTDVDRTTVFEQVVREGYGTPKIYKALGNGHYFKGNFAEAKKWFEKLFETDPLSDATMAFRYKQSLKALNIDSTTNKHLHPSVAGTNEQ